LSGGEARLAAAVAGTPFEIGLATFGEAFLKLRSGNPALAGLGDGATRGLALVLASGPDAARAVSRRPQVLERLARAERDGLAAELAALYGPDPAPEEDLEEFLDGLRVERRDAHHLAACLDLGGVVPFERVSEFLSAVAERVLRRALVAAERARPEPALGVVGMGKIAGRGLTYHSDLDLILLYRDDGPEAEVAARIGQRLIHYVSTMTGTGVAYAIDSRLRPSGRKGTLVTSLDTFRTYQRERAATWEHLALMRGRVVAGDVERAGGVLREVVASITGRGPSIWSEVADMRARVERERANEQGRVPFKTGRGGLMDVEFLAGAARLETGAPLPAGALPSISAMLRACAPGEATEALLRHYGFLRRVEARTRFLAGRAVETLRTSGEEPERVAALFEKGLGPGALLERIETARAEIRRAWDGVVAASSVRALG
jgi:glutamate-ammonia-ligase adenylyltransferase